MILGGQYEIEKRRVALQSVQVEVLEYVKGAFAILIACIDSLGSNITKTALHRLALPLVMARHERHLEQEFVLEQIDKMDLPGARR